LHQLHGRAFCAVALELDPQPPGRIIRKDIYLTVPVYSILELYLGLANASLVVTHFHLAFSCPSSPSYCPTRGTHFLLSLEEALMGKKLYVGNLAYSVNDGVLEQLFAAHGTVQLAQVIMDRETGRSKGFGFVEMGSDQEAQAAIAALNGKD